MSEPRKLQEILPKTSDTQPIMAPVHQLDEDDDDRKRKRISIACIQCRRRKTRCDGQTPCSSCVDRQTECVFDYESDGRRSRFKDVEMLNSRRDKLIRIIEAARRCSDERYAELLDMLRRGVSLTDILDFLESIPLGIRRKSTASQSSSQHSPGMFNLEVETAPFMTRAGSLTGISTSTGHFRDDPSEKFGTRTSRHSISHPTSLPSSSAFGSISTNIVPDDPNNKGSFDLEEMKFQERLLTLFHNKSGPLSAFPVWQYTTGPDSAILTATASSTKTNQLHPLENSIIQSAKYWTNALVDDKDIAKLFVLYQAVWGNSVYFFINFDLFLRDMIPCVQSGELRGTGNYYFSCDLANAFLAVSAFFCTEPFAFADLCEPSTRGEHFIQEASSQLRHLTQIPCLPTAQAYACLALAEGCRGRLGASRRLWLCSLDMFIALIKEPVTKYATPSESGFSQPVIEQPEKTAEQLRQLKWEIRRSIIALGLFCVESIFLSEHNDVRSARATITMHEKSNKEIFEASHYPMTTTSSRSIRDLDKEELELVEIIAIIKLELSNHHPPGFLTTDSQNSESLLELDTAKKLALQLPELNAIYRRLTILRGQMN